MPLLTEDPDISFDELYAAWKEVARLEELNLAAQEFIDVARALYKQQALVDEDCWLGNRPPSMEYLKQVVHFVGNNEDQKNHLDKLDNDLFRLKKELTEAKGILDTLHWKLKVWQTKSANARKTLVE